MHPLNAARRNSALIGQFVASLATTPPKSRLLELLDEAAKECRNERRNASSMERFNDFADALDEIHKARALIVGGQS